MFVGCVGGISVVCLCVEFFCGVWCVCDVNVCDMGCVCGMYVCGVCLSYVNRLYEVCVCLCYVYGL